MERWHYLVGDVHGCYDALLALVDRIERHARRNGVQPYLVSVGDLVDRGPDSASVVAFFRERAAQGTAEAILGNHEQLMLEVVADFRPDLLEAAGASLPDGMLTAPLRHEAGEGMARWLSLEDYRHTRRCLWLGQGGTTTLASWGGDPEDVARWQVSGDDLAFLASRPLLFEAPGVVATHAFVTAGQLERLRRGELVEAALWSRTPPPSPPDPDRTHVSGHTPLERVKRLRTRGCIQVDTGAYMGNRLSAWCPEAGKTLSVSAAGVGC